MRRAPSRASGVALIEALIALAVMAFGMLALVGMQATLRQNGDLSRQRAEAVRIAQQQIEQARAYAAMGTANAPAAGTFSALAGRGPANVANVSGRNATFSVSTVVPEGAGLPTLANNLASLKTMGVNVTWVDRNNEAQGIRLSTAVHGVAPEVAGTVSLPLNGSPSSGAGGRNRAIPWDAVPLGGNKSGFKPPQTSGGNVAWVFNNTSGLLEICSIVNSALPLSTGNITGCGSEQYEVLSGFINFAGNTTAAATASQALNPTGPAFLSAVYFFQTSPASVGGSPVCFTEIPFGAQPSLAYFCAIPIGSTRTRPSWGGYSIVFGPSLPYSPSVGDYVTCRYTNTRNDNPPTAAGPLTNVQHPRAYAGVNGPLTRQNFLVVRSFFGDSRDCPDGSPLPTGSTTYPQPQSPP